MHLYREIRPGKRDGFTLVELLVVIAIIGVLIALLLPAVQKVREAANKLICQSNLRQVGIALHGFHDTNGTFPRGCSVCDDTKGEWGDSWMVYLMPYMELGNVYEKWEHKNASGWTNKNNCALVDGLVVKILRCPSSPLPMYAKATIKSGNTVIGKMNSDYAGISGAYCAYKPGPEYTFSASQSGPSYHEKRMTYVYAGAIHNDGNGGGGPVSGGGLLFPHSKVPIDRITDGTSNTMMAAEQSDWIWDPAGKEQNWTQGGTWGWTMGCEPPESSPPDWQPYEGSPSYPDVTGSATRSYNCMTVRYSINDKHNQPDEPVLHGTGYDMGTNAPIRSTHFGGANVLFADGSMHFLADSTNLGLLKALATRDDGLITGSPD